MIVCMCIVHWIIDLSIKCRLLEGNLKCKHECQQECLCVGEAANIFQKISSKSGLGAVAREYLQENPNLSL